MPVAVHIADSDAADTELDRVVQMCEVLDLSQTNTERVLGAARDADQTEIVVVCCSVG